MSDTGKTITISNEAYLEIKRLNEANADLRELIEDCIDHMRDSGLVHSQRIKCVENQYKTITGVEPFAYLNDKEGGEG